MKEAAPYWDLLVDLYKRQLTAKSLGPSDFGMGLAAEVFAALPKGAARRAHGSDQEPQLAKPSPLAWAVAETAKS